jgi:hypothetical protein
MPSIVENDKAFWLDPKNEPLEAYTRQGVYGPTTPPPAPFGLDDLFGLVVRPNKRQITRAIYKAKVDRWRSIWPWLTFLPWEEMIPPAQ